MSTISQLLKDCLGCYKKSKYDISAIEMFLAEDLFLALDFLLDMTCMCKLVPGKKLSETFRFFLSAKFDQIN